MPCMNRPNRTPLQRTRQLEALKRLDAALAAGTVTVTVGATGAVAFRAWTDREGVTDVCAYRALAAANSAALRRAVMRAEALAGRKLDARTVAAGVHSHDGGQTWHPGH